MAPPTPTRTTGRSKSPVPKRSPPPPHAIARAGDSSRAASSTSTSEIPSKTLSKTVPKHTSSVPVVDTKGRSQRRQADVGRNLADPTNKRKDAAHARFDSLDDDDDDDNNNNNNNSSNNTEHSSGFSPNTLSNRYSAEIDHSLRNKKRTEEIPKMTTLSDQASMFWEIGGASGVNLDSSAGSSNAGNDAIRRSSSLQESRMSTVSTASEQFDLDVEDSYGRTGTFRSSTNKHPKGGVFGQKERFEHVDQSVNLMSMKNDSERGGSSLAGKPGGGIAHNTTQSNPERRTRTRRFGTGTAHSRRRSIFRTISDEMTDIALGRRFSSKNINNNKNDDDSDYSDDSEREVQISFMACCGCLSFMAVLVTVVLFLVGVIPLPEQWKQDTIKFEWPTIPGVTAEKGGENMNLQELVPLISAPPTPVQPQNQDRWDEILAMVVGAHLSRAEDLVNPDTAQYKALAWLSDIDTTSLQGNEGAVDEWNKGILERYALAVFFFSTHQQPEFELEGKHRTDNSEGGEDFDIENDESLKAAFQYNLANYLRRSSNSPDYNFKELSTKGEWCHRTGWLSLTHICEWFGVHCHHNLRVSALMLSRNQLFGEIPRELWALLELNHLDLSYNELGEMIPSTFWQPMGWTNLVTLDVSHNNLGGKLPDAIGGMGKIENITLAGNLLTGELPGSLAKLTNLKVLDLRDNNFTGPIRDTSAIPSLRILRLGGNQLQGDFPIFLTRNRNLIELDLERNRLKGTIPPEIGSLSRLERLCLGSCDFEGPIPDTIGQLTKLELLELQENRIGNQFGQENTPSKLPTILGALTNLKTLKMNSNDIDVEIPDEWWNMTNLEVLHLYDNDLVGSISERIGEFSSLRDFQIQDTYMSGSLPTELGKCQKLESLWIYNAQFTGVVPNEICRLHKDDDATGTTSFAPITAEKKLSMLAADCKKSMKCNCCDRCF